MCGEGDHLQVLDEGMALRIAVVIHDNLDLFQKGLKISGRPFKIVYVGMIPPDINPFLARR